jgi:hypothetical protein
MDKHILKTVLWIRTGFNADPDPDFCINMDADPGSQTNADPDSDPGQIWPSLKL